MTIRDDQVFRIPDDVLYQEVGGETVLLDLDSEQYFGLDAIGTRIWALLGEGRCAEEIVAVLLDEYDVDRERLAADVHELLGALLDAGLIES
ncbi:MAG: PqqD family protein [Xanthomonadales bacterium]